MSVRRETLASRDTFALTWLAHRCKPESHVLAPLKGLMTKIMCRLYVVNVGSVFLISTTVLCVESLGGCDVG